MGLDGTSPGEEDADVPPLPASDRFFLDDGVLMESESEELMMTATCGAATTPGFFSSTESSVVASEFDSSDVRLNSDGVMSTLSVGR